METVIETNTHGLSVVVLPCQVRAGAIMRLCRKLALTIMISLLLLLLSEPCRAAEADDADKPRTLTLADCIVLALGNNLDIKSAFLDRTTQRYALVVAEDKFRPHGSLVFSSQKNSAYQDPGRTTGTNLNAQFLATLQVPTGATFTFAWNNPATKSDVASSYQYNPSWTLSFVQPLLKGAGPEVATADIKVARIIEDQNIFSLKNTLISIISSVTQAYRDFLTAYYQLKIQEKSLETSQIQYETNKSLVSAGRMAETELVQSQADVVGRELAVASAKNGVESARLSLIQILNISKDSFFIPHEETSIEISLPTVEDAVALAMENRPDYLSAKQNLEIARLNLMVADNNRLWDLSFTAGAGISGDSSNIGEAYRQAFSIPRNQWNVGLMLTIPFRDLTIEQSYINAKTGYEKSQLELTKLKTDIEISVKNALRDADMKYRQLTLAKQAKDISRRKLEIEQEKMRVGRSSNFQLVSFQNDLVSAENGEVAASIAYLNALSALDQTLGTTLRTWKIEVAGNDNEAHSGLIK